MPQALGWARSHTPSHLMPRVHWECSIHDARWGVHRKDAPASNNCTSLVPSDLSNNLEKKLRLRQSCPGSQPQSRPHRKHKTPDLGIPLLAGNASSLGPRRGNQTAALTCVHKRDHRGFLKQTANKSPPLLVLCISYSGHERQGSLSVFPITRNGRGSQGATGFKEQRLGLKSETLSKCSSSWNQSTEMGWMPGLVNPGVTDVTNVPSSHSSSALPATVLLLKTCSLQTLI